MLALFYTLILLSVERHGYRTDEVLNRGYQPFILLALSWSDVVRMNWPGYSMGPSGVRTKLHSSVLDAW